MVSGPASRPAVVSLPRRLVISVTVAGGIAVGLVLGRRERAGTRPRLGVVAGDQATDPALVDAVGAGDLALGAASARTAVMIRRALDIPRPSWSGDAYVLRDVMPMS
jgi:hypothetical protein